MTKPRAVVVLCLTGLLLCSSTAARDPAAPPITHHRVGASSAIPLLDEQHVTEMGLTYVRKRHLVREAEARKLGPAFAEAFARLDREYGEVPSALSRSLLGGQSDAGFDIIEVPPAGEVRAAAVFLHGYGGAFTLLCGQFARAVRDLGVLTVCPATSYRADWANAEGRAIVDQTLDELEARGIETVFLAGLSSGGVGATLVAPSVRDRIVGLIAISGARGRPARGVPTLVLHGRQDQRAMYRTARGYAQKAKAKLVAFDGDHWGFLLDEEAYRGPIHRWVAVQLERSTR